MTGTAHAALHKALDWIIEVVEVQPFGEVSIVVTIQNGNIVLIKKSVQETDRP